MAIYRTIDGKNIEVLSPAPTGAGGALIQNNFEALADLTASRQAFYVSDLLDFTHEQDIALVTIPDGYVFFLDRFEALVLSAMNVTTLATAQLGNASDRSLYFGYGLTDRDGSSESSESDDLIYNSIVLPTSSSTWATPYRRVFMAASGSLSIDTAVFTSGQTIFAGVATAAAATSHTGKFLITGMMVQTD